MVKKTGLGRGLDALFSSPVLEDEIEENNTNEAQVKYLKLNEIEPNKNQARKIFDEEAIEELSNSIKEYGVIQPIIVAKKSDYYEIIAGERRWRASKKAGLDTIPAIIKEDDAQRNKEISLIENIQREDLNPIEKARGIKQLMDEYDLTQAKVAEMIGKSRSAVANTVRILNLDERVIDLALEGKLSEGHCRTLIGIEDPNKQYEMALQIIEAGNSVRDLEKKVKIRKKAPQTVEKYAPIYRDIENSFQSFFGTKVKLDAGERKGKIIIQYTSNEDLERILNLIK